MKKNIILLIISSISFLQTAHAMKLTTSDSRKKPLKRSCSDKIKSLPSLRFKKKYHSHEQSVHFKKPTETRLTSLTEENDLDSYMTIDTDEINKIYSHGETLLIWAARNNKTSTAKRLLTNDKILVNHKNHYNLTALHYASQNKNIEIIKQLLLNPQTDASIVNNEHKTARDLIKGTSEHDIELRRIIFARIMLDMTVNNMLKTIQQDLFAAWLSDLDSQTHEQLVLANAISAIKEELITDQDKQKEDERDLPDSAKLPNYANDDFIKQMILLRITKGSV